MLCVVVSYSFLCLSTYLLHNLIWKSTHAWKSYFYFNQIITACMHWLLNWIGTITIFGLNHCQITLTQAATSKGCHFYNLNILCIAVKRIANSRSNCSSTLVDFPISMSGKNICNNGKHWVIRFTNSLSFRRTRVSPNWHHQLCSVTHDILNVSP